MGETFQVWVLPMNTVVSAETLDVASPTGMWHHQIDRRGSPEMYAHSQPLGPRPRDWHVTAAFESPAAAAIDRAIDVVDEALAGDDEARLLHIPAYAIQAIWIVMLGEDQIVPAVVPDTYREKLQPFTVLAASDFLDRLRELRPIRGVIQ